MTGFVLIPVCVFQIHIKMTRRPLTSVMQTVFIGLFISLGEQDTLVSKFGIVLFTLAQLSFAIVNLA